MLADVIAGPHPNMRAGGNRGSSRQKNTATACRWTGGIAPNDGRDRRVVDVDQVVERCFQRFWKNVCRYAASQCGSVDDAQELAQDAFLKLHRALLQGHAIDNPDAWLLATVRDSAIDHIRKKDTQRKHAVDLTIAAQPPRTPEDLLADRTRKALLKAVLRTMTPQHQTALLLRGKGWRLRQIAEHLGISIDRVTTLLSQVDRELGRHFRER